MALTKVQALVAEISLLANGTSTIDIPTAGADIDINVAGANVIDLGTTTITVDDLVTLVANKITSEEIDLSTVSGAAGTMVTDATKMQVGTTSAHNLELMANSVAGLALQTSGKVTLGTVGTALDDLVDKNYVDNLISSGGGAIVPADLVTTLATKGSITIPNSTGNDLIINWGQSSTLNNASEVQTYQTAFTTAYLIGFATAYRSTGMPNDKAPYVAGTPGLTTMTVSNPEGVDKQVNWLAIGY
jgi:hypothetical protein